MFWYQIFRKDLRKQPGNVYNFILFFLPLSCLVYFFSLLFPPIMWKHLLYYNIWSFVSIEFFKKKYVIKIITFHYLDPFKAEKREWTQGTLTWRSVFKQSWLFTCPSIHGELVSDSWWTKAPFELQDISKGVRVRVYWDTNALVKSSFCD